jgi:hypothetical protein
MVTRTLRGRFKDMTFSAMKATIPGLTSPKISARYKDRREITESRANEIERIIEEIRKVRYE